MAGFGLNIAQPATSAPYTALTNADTFQNIIDVNNGPNFGEIIKAATQGSPENGGSGLVLPSRLAMGSGVLSSTSGNIGKETGSSTMTYILYGVAGLAGILIAYKMMRG